MRLGELRNELYNDEIENVDQNIDNNLAQDVIVHNVEANEDVDMEDNVGQDGINVDVIEANAIGQNDSDSSEGNGELDGGESSDSSDEGAAGPAGVNDADRNLALVEDIREWACYGVSIDKVDELLRILQPHHPFLPRTCRTLLQTPTSGPLRVLGGGLFWYKGIFTNLQSRLSLDYLAKFPEILIDVNIDGIPLHDSNSAHFFPILGCLQGEEEPFIIAIWHGYADKPNDLDAFLNEFVEEVRGLQQDGCRIFNNIYNFRIRNYILDAVARSFIKCCIGHNGIFSCEKCDVEGVWVRNRTTYASINFNLRTDESFRDRVNPLHHRDGRSPLENNNTGMVSQFRLDSLHLIFLGVFKRWLSFILVEEGNAVITDEELATISNMLLEIKRHTPSEFNRKPREIRRQSNKFKGHELRRILLYDGLKVFKHLHENIYKNYLMLHCAIYILSCAHLREFLEVADHILGDFLTHSRQVFGRHFIVYNVHSLRHIVKECEEHGTLTDFAAFKYENYLGVIKRLLRSGYRSLQQVYNRDRERDGHLPKPQNNNLDENAILLSNVHERPGGELIAGVQYRKMQYAKITLALNESDCCFMTKDYDVVILSNIVQTFDGNIVLIGRKFARKDNAYTFPINSSLLGIFKVSDLENRREMWEITQLSRKCYILPDGDSYISVPLVHSFRQ